MVGPGSGFAGFFQDQVVQQNDLGTIASVLDVARAAGAPVIYLQVAFAPDFSDLVANCPLLGAAQQMGALTDDAAQTEIVAEVAPTENDTVLKVKRVGGFTNSGLAELLESRGHRHRRSHRGCHQPVRRGHRTAGLRPRLPHDPDLRRAQRGGRSHPRRFPGEHGPARRGSPTFAQRCSQRWFNANLLRFAGQQPSAATRFHQQVTAVTPDDTEVTVTVLDSAAADPTDPDAAVVEYQVTADQLVACDGARSNIRRNLGIETQKSSVWGTSAEAIIRSPQLRALPLAQTLGRFTVLEAAGMSVSLLPFDGLDQYRITLMVGDGEVTEQDMRNLAVKIAGTDVEVEFMSKILPWSNRETVADQSG